MSKNRRKPIISRIPIMVSSNVEFQTIASKDEQYTNAKVMNCYPTIEIAREHYYEDMKRFCENHKELYNFAIRKIVKEESDSNES